MKALDDFTVTQFDFLRHGECEGGEIFRGSTDVVLRPEGVANMQASCDQIDEQWDAIHSSTMKRCHEFAQRLSLQRNIPLVSDNRLVEVRYGDWEGQLRAEVWKHHYAHIAAWLRNPVANTPPNGEPLTDVATRLSAFFAAASSTHRGQKVLVIAHGGAIRVMLATLLGLNLENAQVFDVPFASI